MHQIVHRAALAGVSAVHALSARRSHDGTAAEILKANCAAHIASGLEPITTVDDCNQAVLDNAAAIASLGELVGADTAWILTCTCLVLMMTIPGLALFYGGLSQAPNVLGTIMQSFSITCVITTLWMIFGYSIAFAGNGDCTCDAYDPDCPTGVLSDTCLKGHETCAEGNTVVGGPGKIWLKDVVRTGGSLPESVFITFQATFAIITAAIITGSTAERMRFGPTLIFVAIWHLIVYCPLCHWEWGGGFMSSWGVLDFAGGDVVHISSGVSGLAASLIVGKRKCFAAGATPPPHNILLVFMGGALLWVGWFGFNGGSAVAADQYAGMAMMVTHISASVGGLSWMIIEWIHTGKPSVLGAVSGAVAGLVVITPGSGYLDQTGAFICGLTGGPVCYLGIKIKNLLGFDDALDAFGVHGIGGIWGGILTGILANPEVSGGPGATCFTDATDEVKVGGCVTVDAVAKSSNACGAAFGNAEQIGIQLLGIVVTMIFSFIMTLIILVPMDMILKAATGKGIRVTEEAEDMGLDLSEHGESMVGHPPAGDKVEAIKMETPSTVIESVSNE